MARAAAWGRAREVPVGWLWMLGLVAALAGDPMELRPGVEYGAGARVQSAELGLSFQIPPGWKGGIPPGSEAMLLASGTAPGLVMVLSAAGTQASQVASILAQPLPIDAGLILMPAGAPTTEGDRIRQRFEGQQAGVGALVGIAEARVTDGQTAIAFLAVGPEAEADTYRRLVRDLAGSVRAVARPDPARPEPPSGALAAQLAGRQLHYLKVRDGFSDKVSIDLCRDGSAIRRAHHSGLSTGGVGTLSSTEQSSRRGAWSLAGQTVVITWEDGSTGSWTLESVGGELKVRAENWWVRPGGC